MARNTAIKFLIELLQSSGLKERTRKIESVIISLSLLIDRALRIAGGIREAQEFSKDEKYLEDTPVNMYNYQKQG